MRILDFRFAICVWKEALFAAVMLALALMLAGCESEPDYPPEVAEVARQALADARECAATVKSGVRREGSPRVELVKGEKLISGYWCWRSPEWQGAWVGGLFDHNGDNYRVRIGHNPANRADVRYDVMKHEMGHYVLVTSWGDWTHNNTAFRRCYVGWAEPKAARNKPRPVEIVTGEQIVTIFYEDEINRLESLGVDVAN